MKQNQFTATWEDIGIDYSDWQSDPESFCKRVAQKAREISIELEKPNTIMNNEEQFKAKAMADKEAAKIAEDFISSILEEMSYFSPEVIANIMVRLPEVTKTGQVVVRNMAMRNNRQMSKKRMHAMYVAMRKNYETYCEFLKLFHPELPSMPLIPAKSGNYSSDVATLGVKEFIFKLADEEYYNYYTVARILGIEIKHYMDLVQYFDDNQTAEVDGKVITLELIDISH